MMQRTQISLDPEHHRKAREKAGAMGISLAEYIRRLVERDVDGRGSRADPTEIFDLGDSGGSDIARYKDRYIGEAIEREHGMARRTRDGRTL